MKKVLLLGGTGAMGVYLTEILSALGHSVVVTSRRPREAHGTVSYLCGNAQDDTFLRDCVKRVSPDAIVDFMVYGTEVFQRRVGFLTQASAHYVFLSSYRVYAGEVPLRETSPRLLDVCTNTDYLGTDEYALTKARQEDLLRAMHGGNAWTIVRPAITFSKERFQFGVLEANTVCWRALHGLPLVMPAEMLDKRTTLTWGRDVAMMIARLVLNPKAYGEAFTAATAEAHTWREVFEIYRKTIGATLVECSMADYLTITQVPWQVRYDRMFDRVVDNSKVLAATGMTQADLTPLDEALSRELAAFREHPHYAWLDWGRTARMDKVLGLPMPRGLSWRERMDYQMARHPNLARNLPMRGVRWLVRKVRGQ